VSWSALFLYVKPTDIVSLNSVFMFASVVLYSDARETLNYCQFVKEVTPFVLCMATYFNSSGYSV